MIDFNDLMIDRLIIHIINAKKNDQDSAKAEFSSELSVVDDNGLKLIKERLINAIGRDSKSFELIIDDESEGSFIKLIDGINLLPKKEFIKRSTEIADHLASSQLRSGIPGGYFMLISGHFESNQLPIYIVIKAEPHEALQFNNHDNHNELNVLQKVFLSPSQKLFKIGIVYGKDLTKLEINLKFGCIIYDEQFRIESHPAEYFYKLFLGFSIGENAKIQTQRFYDKTESFIKKYVTDNERKRELISALKLELGVNNNSTLTTKTFADAYFTKDGLNDKFLSIVGVELPTSFIKDTVLIKGKLKNRKIEFGNLIHLTGPEEVFDKNVRIVLDDKELKKLVTNSSEYSIIQIIGKPYKNEE